MLEGSEEELLVYWQISQGSWEESFGGLQASFTRNT